MILRIQNRVQDHLLSFRYPKEAHERVVNEMPWELAAGDAIGGDAETCSLTVYAVEHNSAFVVRAEHPAIIEHNGATEKEAFRGADLGVGDER